MNSSGGGNFIEGLVGVLYRSALLGGKLAILLTAAAGVFPIAVQIWTTSEGKPVIAPAWASVLVAGAVLFIAIDRFFGFSSAWMRFITAELTIKQARDAFEFDWQAANASFGGKPPTDDQVRFDFDEDGVKDPAVFRGTLIRR